MIFDESVVMVGGSGCDELKMTGSDIMLQKVSADRSALKPVKGGGNIWAVVVRQALNELQTSHEAVFPILASFAIFASLFFVHLKDYMRAGTPAARTRSPAIVEASRRPAVVIVR